MLKPFFYRHGVFCASYCMILYVNVARYPLHFITLTAVLILLLSSNIVLSTLSDFTTKLYAKQLKIVEFHSQIHKPSINLQRLHFRATKNIDKTFLLFLFDFQRLLENVKVPCQLNNSKVCTWNDICFKPFESCFKHTPLDFWDYHMDAIVADINPIDTLLNANAFSWFQIPLSKQTVLGGLSTKLDEQGNIKIIGASDLIFTYLLDLNESSLPNQNSEKLLVWDDLVKKVFEELQLSLHFEKDEFLSYWKSDIKTKHFFYEYGGSNIFTGEFTILLVSYILVFLYISLVMSKIDMVKSKFGLGFTAVVMIFSSLFMSVGLWDIFGMNSSLVPWEVLPFLVIAIGVENILVLTNSVVSTSIDLPVKERVGLGLSKVAIRMSYSLGVQLLILLFGSMINVPAIQEFCLFAAVSVVIDYFMQTTFFVSVLSIDIRRLELHKLPRLKNHPQSSPVRSSPSRRGGKVGRRRYSWTRQFIRKVQDKAALSWSVLVILLIMIVLGFGLYGSTSPNTVYSPEDIEKQNIELNSFAASYHLTTENNQNEPTKFSKASHQSNNNNQKTNPSTLIPPPPILKAFQTPHTPIDPLVNFRSDQFWSVVNPLNLGIYVDVVSPIFVIKSPFKGDLSPDRWELPSKKKKVERFRNGGTFLQEDEDLQSYLNISTPSLSIVVVVFSLIFLLMAFILLTTLLYYVTKGTSSLHHFHWTKQQQVMGVGGGIGGVNSKSGVWDDIHHQNHRKPREMIEFSEFLFEIVEVWTGCVDDVEKVLFGGREDLLWWGASGGCFCGVVNQVFEDGFNVTTISREAFLLKKKKNNRNLVFKLGVVFDKWGFVFDGAKVVAWETGSLAASSSLFGASSSLNFDDARKLEIDFSGWCGFEKGSDQKLNFLDSKKASSNSTSAQKRKNKKVIKSNNVKEDTVLFLAHSNEKNSFIERPNFVVVIFSNGLTRLIPSPNTSKSSSSSDHFEDYVIRSPILPTEDSLLSNAKKSKDSSEEEWIACSLNTESKFLPTFLHLDHQNKRIYVGSSTGEVHCWHIPVDFDFKRKPVHNEFHYQVFVKPVFTFVVLKSAISFISTDSKGLVMVSGDCAGGLWIWNTEASSLALHVEPKADYSNDDISSSDDASVNIGLINRRRKKGENQNPSTTSSTSTSGFGETANPKPSSNYNENTRTKFRIPGHSSKITNIHFFQISESFSSSKNIVVTSSEDESVCFWEIILSKDDSDGLVSTKKFSSNKLNLLASTSSSSSSQPPSPIPPTSPTSPPIEFIRYPASLTPTPNTTAPNTTSEVVVKLACLGSLVQFGCKVISGYGSTVVGVRRRFTSFVGREESGGDGRKGFGGRWVWEIWAVALNDLCGGVGSDGGGGGEQHEIPTLRICQTIELAVDLVFEGVKPWEAVDCGNGGGSKNGENEFLKNLFFWRGDGGRREVNDVLDEEIPRTERPFLMNSQHQQHHHHNVNKAFEGGGYVLYEKRRVLWKDHSLENPLEGDNDDDEGISLGGEEDDDSGWESDDSNVVGGSGSAQGIGEDSELLPVFGIDAIDLSHSGIAVGFGNHEVERGLKKRKFETNKMSDIKNAEEPMPSSWLTIISQAALTITGKFAITATQSISQQHQTSINAYKKPPPISSEVKRFCHTSPLFSVGDLIKSEKLVDENCSLFTDVHGLKEFSMKDTVPISSKHCCGLCQPNKWVFDGSQYDSYLTCLYAEKDGCIPSSVVTKLPKFIIPWRYKNKKSGEISWKIYHLHKDRIQGAENETIVVNPYKDHKLRAVIEYVSKNYLRYPHGVKLVEFLLKVVQETLGDYGIPGGPTSTDADEKIYEKMLSQGHNFVLLCEVSIGVCRHKALLFKLLCDVVHMNCAVVTGYSTAGRHQWNIVSLMDEGDFLIDPTSRHFTWAKPGSVRTKGYKILIDESLGHAGFSLKAQGFI